MELKTIIFTPRSTDGDKMLAAVRTLEIGDYINLVPEPNQHDPQAIACYTEMGFKLGYLLRASARQVHSLGKREIICEVYDTAVMKNGQLAKPAKIRLQWENDDGTG